MSRKVAKTMRDMDAVAERIRDSRMHARVNPAYRAALVELGACCDWAILAAGEDTVYGPKGEEVYQLHELYWSPAAVPSLSGDATER